MTGTTNYLRAALPHLGAAAITTGASIAVDYYLFNNPINHYFYTTLLVTSLTPSMFPKILSEQSYYIPPVVPVLLLAAPTFALAIKNRSIQQQRLVATCYVCSALVQGIFKYIIFKLQVARQEQQEMLLWTEEYVQNLLHKVSREQQSLRILQALGDVSDRPALRQAQELLQQAQQHGIQASQTRDQLDQAPQSQILQAQLRQEVTTVSALLCQIEDQMASLEQSSNAFNRKSEQAQRSK